MKMKNIIRSAIVTAVVVAMALTASLNAGETQGNPFKKGKKQHKHKLPPGQVKRAQPRPTTFSGQAVAIDLTNAQPAFHWIVGDTGPLPSAGGTLNVTVSATNIPGVVDVGMATASVIGGGSQSSAQAQVQNFSAVFISADGVTNSLSFAFAEAIAQAQCGSNGPALSASTQVQGLVINGVSITPTGETNQIIAVSNGTVVLNAILASGGTKKHAKIGAAAIFLALNNGFSGTIAFAEADISCGTAPATNGACGKVTGGGFIATGSGTNGSFGVSGGVRRGQFWGHLNYIDHGTGMHVTSTEVTSFTVVDSLTRQIDYNVSIDGVPGTARVVVSDQGEPGRNDIFDITLSTGYHAGGDLGGSGAGGGNIQLHKCPPGWLR